MVRFLWTFHDKKEEVGVPWCGVMIHSVRIRLCLLTAPKSFSTVQLTLYWAWLMYFLRASGILYSISNNFINFNILTGCNNDLLSATNILLLSFHVLFPLCSPLTSVYLIYSSIYLPTLSASFCLVIVSKLFSCRWWWVCLSVCARVCMCVYGCVCLSVCMLSVVELLSLCVY